MSSGEIEHGLLHHHDPIQEKGHRVVEKDEIPNPVAFEEASSAVGSDNPQPRSPPLDKRPRHVQPIVDDVLKQQMHQLLLELLGILLCSQDFRCPGARKLSNGKPSLRTKQDRVRELHHLHGSQEFAPKGVMFDGLSAGALHTASGQGESVGLAAVRIFAQRPSAHRSSTLAEFPARRSKIPCSVA